jgi:hypothetical protein
LKLRVGAAAALVMLLAAGEAAATVRMFAYDPANDETRHVAGPLTFEFNQKLIFTTLLSIKATEAEATADVKPVDEKVLGRGGLSALIGPTGPERDLYEVEPGEEGDAMIKAFCPDSKHGWVALGRIKAGRDLRVRVIGDTPEGGVKLCHTFDFRFHGEWKIEERPTVGPHDMKAPHFPYGG